MLVEPKPPAPGRSPIRQGKATLAIRGEGIGRPTVLCISAVAAQVCVQNVVEKICREVVLV